VRRLELPKINNEPSPFVRYAMKIYNVASDIRISVIADAVVHIHYKPVIGDGGAPIQFRREASRRTESAVQAQS
jgi:hypothetical protein